MIEEQTIEKQILEAMVNMRQKGITPVHPKFVSAWLLHDGKSERVLRYRMAQMAEEGRLVRVSERGGYALPSLRVAEVPVSENARLLSNADKRALLWKWIREKDPRAGWSQRMLAAHLGVGKSSIGRWQKEYLASGPFGPVGLKTVRVGMDGRLYDVRGIIRANRARLATA